MISKVNNMSFKGYIPVRFFANDPETGESDPIISQSNMRKCQGFVVRNLNDTAKKAKNDEFVEEYKKYDPDYVKTPRVMSFYTKTGVEMITGKDSDDAKLLAKPIGIAKGQSMDIYGHAKSFEAKYASRNYAENMKNFLNKKCKRVKAKSGKNLVMNVYFNPKYTRTQELKGFEYDHVEFVTEG